MPPLADAEGLMLEFAERTGLGSQRPPQRYLWTDAFAVCSFVALHERTGQERYARLACNLVDQVHATLGKHRQDDARRGWLSGESEDGTHHPTRAGLRIGKPEPERSAGDLPDERREWNRDGQYFHYLTKWMTALNRVGEWTREARYNVWARELAETAHHAFVYQTPTGERRMFWKTSIDLSRPLVASMGQHDPLDGYVTCQELRATALALASSHPEPTLTLAARDFERMLAQLELTTADPLGLGGLLMDACRLEQLRRCGTELPADLQARLLRAALSGLRHYVQQGELELRAASRLAFRELGLAIGLSGLSRLVGAPSHAAEHDPATLSALASYLPLRSHIVGFWLDPANRRSQTWLGHRDINDVMLATSLVPEGCLPLSAGA